MDLTLMDKLNTLPAHVRKELIAFIRASAEKENAERFRARLDATLAISKKVNDPPQM